MTDTARKGTLPEPGQTAAPDSDGQEIDLLELFYKLLENLKWIILAALLGALLAAGYSFLLAKPVYEATAKLYVLSANDSAINLSDLQIGAALTSDYQEVFKTWEVHEMVIANLGLNYSYAQMQSMLTVTNPNDTRILQITVRSGNPQQAVDIANEYASVARTYISETMATEKPSVLSNALLPVNPVSPQKTRNIMLGFILGLLAACAVVVVRFITDDKLKNADDIRKYVDLPTLAIIPVLTEKKENEKTGKRRKKAS